MTPPSRDELLAAARGCAAEGLATVALWSIDVDPLTDQARGCTCSNGAQCPAPGKHPVSPRWQNGPTDLTPFGRLHVPLNLGIRTGPVSGIFVVDIDDHDAWRHVSSARGPMARTRFHRTGSGGFHLLFKLPDFPVTNSTGSLPKGIDIRGAGGQIVAPPSLHILGRRYEVGMGDGGHPDPIAPAPGWLLDHIRPRERITTASPARVQLDASRPQTKREAALEKAVIEGELTRLDDLERPWRKDALWDETTYKVCTQLIELANAGWSTLTLEEANRLVMERAPRDEVWDKAGEKWASAWRSVGDKARVSPSPAGAVDDAFSPDYQPAAATAVVGSQARQPSSTLLEGAALPAVAEFTDTAQVDEVSTALRGLIAWSPGYRWLRWDKRRWATVHESVVVELVRSHQRSKLRAAASASDPDPARLRALAGLLSRPRLLAVVELMRGAPGIAVADDDLDAHPDLLNVGNGVVDLTTGQLRPHDPALFLTKVTEVDFHPGATHPDWVAALTALPDPDVVDYVQVRIGQAATGHTPDDDKLLCTIGGGSNGKSAILGAVRNVLGDHAALVPDRLLLARPGDHPTELMTLRGVRFALAEELPEEGTLNVQRLKAVVGTAWITARLIRADSVEFKATHTLVLTTNYRPRVVQTDDGAWRRLMALTFPLRFRGPHEALEGPQDRRGDPTLRGRLAERARREAVLAWLVEGAHRRYAAGRVMPAAPESIIRATEEWRLGSDQLGQYLDERIVFDASSSVLTRELLEDFGSWQSLGGHATWGEQLFTERLTSHRLVLANGVTKARPRTLHRVSRRDPKLEVSTPLKGNRQNVWSGVRFRRASDDLEALTSANTGVTRGDLGSSDNRPEDSPHGVIGTPRVTPGHPLSGAAGGSWSA